MLRVTNGFGAPTEFSISGREEFGPARISSELERHPLQAWMPIVSSG